MSTVHRPHASLPVRNLLASTVVAVVFAVLAAAFGVAWWTVWREKPSARRWGITASLMNILLSLFPLMLAIFFSLSFRGYLAEMVTTFGIIFVIGVVGLVAFCVRYEQPNPTLTAQENVGIAGDGTSSLLNQTAEFLVFAAGLGAYYWWLGWLRAKAIPTNHGYWQGTILAVLVVLIIVTLHEFGHTATGLALGMKLRAFVAGPFQWHIHDGKWEFQFKPAAILSLEGATGLVPASADFPRRSYLYMIAAGPFANLLTGLFALWMAFAAEGNSRGQAGGLLALFGAWSSVAGAVNLLPVRTKRNYSDGATIYQLLAGGPWADSHQVAAVIGSSLVTPLRPRNYNIELIRRVAHSFTQGKQALFLRLYAYTYFLDHGKILEAGEALREAESIYEQSASDITPELHTVFVFGSAYVLRDAAAARLWWTRMESKKPTRFNVDYWTAASALHWIEGNVEEANAAWEKAHALAQRLPKAGAYEFDGYCCCLLRKALDTPISVPAIQ